MQAGGRGTAVARAFPICRKVQGWLGLQQTQDAVTEGFLAFAIAFCSPPRCPTDAPQLMKAITSLTYPLHFAPLPSSTSYCHVQGHSSQEIFSALAKATTQSPAETTLMGMGLSLWIHSWKNQKDSWLLLSLPIKNSLH